jgi:hypothetical protein
MGDNSNAKAPSEVPPLQKAEVFREGRDCAEVSAVPPGRGDFFGRYQPLRSWLSSGCAAGTISFRTGSDRTGVSDGAG